MFTPTTYQERRATLRREMAECRGIILLPGNELLSNSYPGNKYYFRQDGTFRYFFGLDQPSLWGIIDIESGDEILFGQDPTIDDIIWDGVRPQLAELGAMIGVADVRPLEDVQKVVGEALRLGRRVHILPPYQGETKIAINELLGTKHYLDGVSGELMYTVAKIREIKSAEEVAELEAAYAIGYEIHTAAMKMCRPGIVEREIGGMIEGISRSMGGGVSFPPICSQHGETLHNTSRYGVLESGRLFLCDAGAESLTGYCTDHTRTYPIDKTFTPIQRDMYNIVLNTHNRLTDMLMPGVCYPEIMRATFTGLAEGLRDLGLVNGAIEDIVDSGAMYMFMPCGVGHGMGLDVHDCEAIGERSFDAETYARITAPRTADITTCIKRDKWCLSEGVVMTNEPGIYFIKELIEKSRREGLYTGFVDYDRLEQFYNFGGVRIEDSFLITASGAKLIGETYEKKIPKTVEEVEEFIRENRD